MHAPGIVIKVDVGAALEVLGGNRRFFVSLEPSHVVFVEPPRVSLELSGCEVLLVGALHVRVHTHRWYLYIRVHGHAVGCENTLNLSRPTCWW